MLGDDQSKQGRSKLRSFLVLSIIFHAIFFWVLGQRGVWDLWEISPLEPFQVTLIEKSELEQQIVEFEKKTDEAPTDPKFLAKHNHKADKETVAKAKPSTATILSAEDVRQLLEKPRVSRQDFGQSAMVAKFFPKEIFEETAQEQHEKQVRMKRSLASSELRDYIQKIEVGNQTILNTGEFKFYSYFTRIKHQVHRNWTERVQGAALKSWVIGRPLASTIMHETQLIIVLDEQGKIEKILVKKSSGIKALDEASVEAFLESGPFPNPPKDLLQDRKNIQITWSFFVNVT